jgi:WD40 repeat protein
LNEEGDKISALLEDAMNTIHNFHEIITISALQVYHSVVLFMPNCQLYDLPSTRISNSMSRLLSPRPARWGLESEPLPEGGTDRITPVAFSPDGSLIVTSNRTDYTLLVRNTSSGNIVLNLKGHQYPVISAAFSHDGSRIVSGSRDCTVRIWDATTGAILQTFEGHRKRVTSVAFSPDNLRVVSGGGDGDSTVRVWDIKSGSLVGAPLEGHAKRVTAVSFSSDGSRVISGSDDGTTRAWDTNTGKYASVMHQRHETSSPSAGYSTIFRFDENTGWLLLVNASNTMPIRLCWIPNDIRPGRSGFVSYKSKVAMGSNKGIVTILDFSSHQHAAGSQDHVDS